MWIKLAVGAVGRLGAGTFLGSGVCSLGRVGHRRRLPRRRVAAQADQGGAQRERDSRYERMVRPAKGILSEGSPHPLQKLQGKPSR